MNMDRGRGDMKENENKQKNEGLVLLGGRNAFFEADVKKLIA